MKRKKIKLFKLIPKIYQTCMWDISYAYFFQVSKISTFNFSFLFTIKKVRQQMHLSNQK